MDRRERDPDEEEVLRLAFESMQARLWTCMPGVVQKVDLTVMTADVKPTIMAFAPNKDGSLKEIQLPVLPDCPIHFPGGGGSFLEFPLAAGDEVLVIMSSRSIDRWWYLSGVQSQSEPGRMHNLSDAFCFPRVWSKPNALTIDSKPRWRNTANTAYIEMDPVMGSFNIVAPAGVTINGVTVSSTGAVHSPTTILADTDVVAGTKSGKTHTHNDPQGGLTAGPN